jgi:DNA polymerase
MSERDARKEAAELARSLRRYLERERGSPAGDLLALGTGESRRSRASATRPAATRSAAASRVAPAGEERPPIVAEAPRAAVVASAVGSTPKISTTYVVEDEEATPAENVDLFEAPGAKASKRAASAPVVLRTELNPAGLASRAEILAASVPVLEEVAGQARACTKCGLCKTRTQAVPGVGSASSGIVFVGEAPGADEDRRGEPFVGRAGELLTRIIKAMDDAQLIPGVPLNRESVYICNVLKCRPPENRNPLPHEVETCSPYLERQLEALAPRVICCLGKFAAELLVGAKGTIGGLRGKVYRYHGAKLIVTYHPAACLRNPAYKRPVWEDMQLLAREYQTD